MDDVNNFSILTIVNLVNILVKVKTLIGVAPGSLRFLCFPSTTFWAALRGLVGLRRLPMDVSRSIVNMQ